MFREESVWIKEILAKIKPSTGNNKVANLGSSSEELRKVFQPHIHNNIVQPLMDTGWDVIHVDFKGDVGVDVVADLTNKDFGNGMKDAFALTICTNMLEHVLDIPLVVSNLFKVTAHGGYILLTVPYKYKIHHDPIDNGFRPNPDEIAALFNANEIEIVDKKVIVIHEKSYYPIRKSKYPIWGYREIIKYHLGKKHKVSGILLKKK